MLKAAIIGLLVSAIGSQVLACEVARALTETQFVIDPASKTTKMNSKTNNAQIGIERCTSDEKYILVNFNSIYYQDDTSRLESISGNLVQNKSNCSIETSVPFQRIDNQISSKLLAEKNEFQKQCVQLIISDIRGFKVKTHPKSQCKITSLNEQGSTVVTDGNGCFIAVDTMSKLNIEQKINPDCYNSQFLNENQIQAADYESVIKLWPVSVEAGELKVQSPIGARYVRHTLLPAKGFMPRSIKESNEDSLFVSAITTNISPGSVNLIPSGKNKALLQPSFLVENFAKEFCKDGTCARTSSYSAPVVGKLRLYNHNIKTQKTNLVSSWVHALKIPSNWTGLAEFRTENNLSGVSMGALEINPDLLVDQELTLVAEFYEPRSSLDELTSSDDYLNLNSNLDVSNSYDEERLPSLPKAGQLGQLSKLASLPTISLGQKGIIEFSDAQNMKKSWSNYYDRVCDSKNLNCFKLSGTNKSFIRLEIKFSIDTNKNIIPLSVKKSSPVFENYQLNIVSFAKKVCQ